MAAQVYGGRWQIEKELSAGGQAHTFLVTDVNSDDKTHWVLKRLKNPKRIGRFRAEVEAAFKLDHPNILKVIDHGLECEEPYFVTEYCAGGTLEGKSDDFCGSVEKSLRVIKDVAFALVAAHQSGVVHRDVKPANIFFRENGEPVLGDFGLCFFTESGERFTLTQEQVGSRYFMAPEVEDGRSNSISPRCDVYSLGKVLYWMVSGGRLFNREKHKEAGFDLRETWPNDESLVYMNQLLDKMIVYDPRTRYASAVEVFEAARNAMRLIDMNCVPLDPDAEIRCRFCGQDAYERMPEPRGTHNSVGIQNVGVAEWRVLVCKRCGHVQLFRADMTESKQWPFEPAKEADGRSPGNMF